MGGGGWPIHRQREGEREREREQRGQKDRTRNVVEESGPTRSMQ